MNDWYEREEDLLLKELNEGQITREQFNKAMWELNRDYQAQAQEAAENAYNEEMGRW